MDYSAYHDSGYRVISSVFQYFDCIEYIKEAEFHAGKNFDEIHNIERKSLIFSRLVRHPWITNHVRIILGDERIACLGSMIHFRKPGTHHADGFWSRHQDNGYVRAPYGTMLTVHVALTDSFSENGGLWVAPGTHKEQILPHFMTIQYVPPLSFKPRRFVPLWYGFKWPLKTMYSYRQTPLNLTAGSICLQHGNLLHGSYPNHTDRPRVTMGIMYIKQGVSFNSGIWGQRKAVPI